MEINRVVFPYIVGNLFSKIGRSTLIISGKTAAIYRKDSVGDMGTPSFDGYEVVLHSIRPFRIGKMGGNVVVFDRKFAYPSSEEFGSKAWAFGRTGRMAAIRKFIKLEYGSASTNR